LTPLLGAGEGKRGDALDAQEPAQARIEPLPGQPKPTNPDAATSATAPTERKSVKTKAESKSESEARAKDKAAAKATAKAAKTKAKSAAKSAAKKEAKNDAKKEAKGDTKPEAKAGKGRGRPVRAA
jgi:septal ring-binding cell division protein DamX